MILFRDGFESGDLSTWSGYDDNGGDLSVAEVAALHGNYGLNVYLDGSQTHIFVMDNTPLDETRYRCRFYFDPNSFTMAENDIFAIFYTLDKSSNPAFIINLKYTYSHYRVSVLDYTDGAYSKATLYYALLDSLNCIEVDWRAASGVGEDDGQITLIVNKVIKEILTGIDSDTETITQVRLGACSGLDVGTSGTFYMDDFVSNNDGTEIGCIGDFPNILDLVTPLKCTTTKEINGPYVADVVIKKNDYIKAENYIEFAGEPYIVKKLKKVRSGGSIYFDVSLDHFMSELSQAGIERFYIKDTVSNHLDYILADTDWNAGTCDIVSTVLLDVDRRIPVLEALYMLAEKCDGELYFNSDRTVDLKDEIGTVTNLFLSMGKNCNYLEREEDSSYLITRLYPYGPDNRPINCTVIDKMDNASLWIASGTSVSAAITVKKMEGSGCVQFTDNGPGDTLQRDLGAGNELDLSGLNTIEFWIYDPSGLGIDFSVNNLTFGIGEVAWDDNTIVINTGTVNADSWKKITIDISGVADGDKDAIRYIGFQGSGLEIYLDDIIAVGKAYIDSPNRKDYKYPKEAIFFHSAVAEITQKTINILPTDDARTYQGSPTTNFGSIATLAIRDENPYSEISFVKFGNFTQIPANATITSATLRMYVSNVVGGGETVDINLSADDWNENTITWNNKPAAGANIDSVAMNDNGWKTADLIDLLNDWLDGTEANYGLRLEMTGVAAHKGVLINSKENSEYKIRLEVAYTLSSGNPAQTLEDAAQIYLNDHDEPKLRYVVKIADLSRAIADTWRDETINLGDTVKVYDKELDINVYCRIKKIVKDLLYPENTQIELTNKTYDITDTQALLEKKIKYLQPFENDWRAAYANSVKEGYTGGRVNQ